MPIRYALENDDEFTLRCAAEHIAAAIALTRTVADTAVARKRLSLAKASLTARYNATFVPRIQRPARPALRIVGPAVESGGD